MIKFILKKFYYYQKALKLVPIIEQLENQARSIDISNVMAEKERIKKDKEVIESKKLKEQALNEIKMFFNQNALKFGLLSTSTETLFECFKHCKYNYRFRTGILNQDYCVKATQNELINIIDKYNLSGDYIIDNFNISKNFVDTFQFSTVADYNERTGAIHDFISTPHPGLFAQNYSLLMLCSYFGMNQVIEYLIKNGCDVFYQTSENESALSLYQSTSINPQKEIDYIKSLLNGTYNNGEYVAYYEQKKLLPALNELVIKNTKVLKI
jgi:hypothetical protein